MVDSSSCINPFDSKEVDERSALSARLDEDDPGELLTDIEPCRGEAEAEVGRLNACVEVGKWNSAAGAELGKVKAGLSGCRCPWVCDACILYISPFDDEPASTACTVVCLGELSKHAQAQATDSRRRSPEFGYNVSLTDDQSCQTTLACIVSVVKIAARCGFPVVR